MGKGLNGRGAAYNKAVGSLETRVLVTARRFVEKGVVAAGEKELPRPAPVDAIDPPPAVARAQRFPPPVP